MPKEAQEKSILQDLSITIPAHIFFNPRIKRPVKELYGIIQLANQKLDGRWPKDWKDRLEIIQALIPSGASTIEIMKMINRLQSDRLIQVVNNHEEVFILPTEDWKKDIILEERVRKRLERVNKKYQKRVERTKPHKEGEPSC